MGDLIENIRRNTVSFTPAQRRVAEYVMKHLEEVAFMSASTFGRKAGVSESTIVRFSQLLGYRGFPELKEAIREIVIHRLDTSRRLSDYLGSEGKEHVLFETMRKDMSVLELAMDTVSVEEFDKVVDVLEAADRVFVIAHRSAYVLAYYLTFYLRWVGLFAFTLRAEDTSCELIMSLTDGDVVIGITFPRYSRDTVELFTFAAKRGIRTVAITDDYLSPIAHIASYTLAIPTDFVSFVDSFTAPMSVINAIVIALSMRNPELTEKRLEALEEVWKDRRLYWDFSKPLGGMENG